MGEVILEALYDGVKAFVVVFLVYIVLSFIELKVANKLKKEHKLSPLYGAIMGLVPQCGISVVGADLYLKRHISVGTLMAIFIACSDEAIPIILSSGDQKSLMVLPLILAKVVIGFVVGCIADMVISNKEVKEHLNHCEDEDIEVHTGCCHHEIDNEKVDGFEKHLWHPLIHSLKLFGYILVINLIFGMIVYFIGENNLISFP